MSRYFFQRRCNSLGIYAKALIINYDLEEILVCPCFTAVFTVAKVQKQSRCPSVDA